MNEDYVSYGVALALKKCGFDEPCDHYWYKEFANSGKMALRQASADDFNNDDWNVPHCSAPTLWQAQKWLRDKKSIEVVVEPRFSNWKRIGYDWSVFDDYSGDYSLRAPLPFTEIYENALAEGIKGALQLIIKQTK